MLKPLLQYFAYYKGFFGAQVKTGNVAVKNEKMANAWTPNAHTHLLGQLQIRSNWLEDNRQREASVPCCCAKARVRLFLS